MRKHRWLTVVAMALLLSACAGRQLTQATLPFSPTQLQEQVLAAERAFAQTMADRDQRAFASFIADDAIFFSGDNVLRGKAAVLDGWRPYYQAAQPPFSWQPETVEVQASGMLALSTGPVRDPNGKIVAQFSSIWRQEAPGVWRVIFDKGNPVCPAPTPP